MQFNHENELDAEFKRYLKIMRPYLGQLDDQNTIDVCEKWIQRLTNCSDSEKIARNKYIFYLCYQLARGQLEKPFIDSPPNDSLPGFSTPAFSIGSETSSELECLVVEPDEENTNIWMNSKVRSMSVTDYISRDRNRSYSMDSNELKKSVESLKRKHEHASNLQKNNMFSRRHSLSTNNSTIGLKNCYEQRTHNVIKKLRDIKKQNFLLNCELKAFRKEANNRITTECDDYSDFEQKIYRVDNSTSICFDCGENNVSYQNKMEELQESLHKMVQTIEKQQEIIKYFDGMKKNDIAQLTANHNFEIIKLKSKLGETNEMKAVDLHFTKSQVDELITKKETDFNEIIRKKDEIIEEKDKKILENEFKIKKLEETLLEQKNKIESLTGNNDNADDIKIRAQYLEKQLAKMEKARHKNSKMLQAKLVLLQREKHLSECSLQLQLVKQRAQISSELVDESQIELQTALNKLENKYKHIVGNVQIAAIKRRVQDQMTLEALLQTTITTKNENNAHQSKFHYDKSNNNQSFIPGNSKNTNKDVTDTYESEIASLFHNDHEEHTANNRSFESQSPKYCLKSEQLHDFFEKIVLPQKE